MDDPRLRTDTRVLQEIAEALYRTRLDRGLTQATLAVEAGVSKRTVERIESGQSAQLSSFIRILRALGLLSQLDALIPPPVESPIEQLRRADPNSEKKRRRAPSADRPDAPASDWRWGDDPCPSRRSLAPAFDVTYAHNRTATGPRSTR